MAGSGAESQIQRQVDAVDALGQPQQVWPTILTCRAAINYESKLANREFYAEGFIAARTMPTITRMAAMIHRTELFTEAPYVDGSERVPPLSDS